MKTYYNVIKIKYDPSDIYGKENINIDIKNTSYGALGILVIDLKDSIKRMKTKDAMCFAEGAYYDLITKLVNKLDKQLKNKNK